VLQHSITNCSDLGSCSVLPNIILLHSTCEMLFHLHPRGKDGLPVPSVSRLTNSQQYYFIECLYQISPQSDNKCGKYRFKFLYTPTRSVTDSQYTDFHKTRGLSSIVVDICSELHPNEMRIVENRGRGLLTTWLSGH